MLNAMLLWIKINCDPHPLHIMKPPMPNMTAFGHRAFNEVMKLKWGL